MRSRDVSGLDAFFRLLGKEGSFEILEEASGKLTSGKDTIREIGLSQKLYYSRLSELRRLGLVEKEGIRTYMATEKGRLVLDLQSRLTRALRENRASLPVEGRVIPDYAAMVKTLSEQINRSRSRIKLATRYIDPTVAKSTFDAIDRHVTVEVLFKSGRTHLGKMALELLSLVRSDLSGPAERLWKTTKVADIPFSFAVVDGHWSGIELVGPNETFLSAVEFEGDSTAAALTLLFRHYYRVGTVFPRFW